MSRARGILAMATLLAACGRREATTATAPPATSTLAPSPPRTQSAPNPTIPFTVTSDIPECLEVVGTDEREDGNLLLAEVGLKTTAILARCVCISKWLLYRSVTSTEGLDTEFASGSILAAEPGAPPLHRDVVLLSDRGHPPKQPLILHVGCAPAP